ncbi:MAG: methylated-DNA--[protein]-cysteine S-methyltransferase [Patescibacteria group bacterium]
MIDNVYKSKVLNSEKLTEFEKAVLIEIMKIKKGSVITYKELAIRIGKPKAFRAVGNALRKNPYAPMIPCHRVIKSSGKIGGYGGSIKSIKKTNLLKKEGFII